MFFQWQVAKIGQIFAGTLSLLDASASITLLTTPSSIRGVLPVELVQIPGGPEVEEDQRPDVVHRTALDQTVQLGFEVGVTV